jgi:hypothetical protein
MRRWLRSWILGVAFITLLCCGPVAAASSFTLASPAAAGKATTTAVQDCGVGPALVRPGSLVLTCADSGEQAVGLHWSSWGTTRATATGRVIWRVCSADCAASRRWASTAADISLTTPVPESGGRLQFTRLVLRVTGRTPQGFMRDLTFSEAPLTPLPAASRASGPAQQPSLSPLTSGPSGTITYAAAEGYWIAAGGPTTESYTFDYGPNPGTYTFPQIAAAIAEAESSLYPGNIQPGVDYCDTVPDQTGWGLWQITCGNSVPQYGVDYQMLDPWENAEAAVYKCDASIEPGSEISCFNPWTSFTTNASALDYLSHTAPDTAVTDPGQYVNYHSAPADTPSTSVPDPGSTYGPPMPGSGTAYVFWKGGPDSNYDLWEAQGPANNTLRGPYDQGSMGPLNSAPAAGVDENGYTYVFWEGGPDSNYDLWEAYWNGTTWVGPVDRGMGPLDSAPSVAVSPSGTAYVFWKGGPDSNYDLFEASGPANPTDGALTGPINRGMGPLDSAPTVGIDSNNYTYVYWEGGPNSNNDLWEAYWNGSAFAGPYNRGMGPLGSAPSVAVTKGGTAYVFWEGGPDSDNALFEAQGPATGALAGPTNRGMGPLNSGPTAGVNLNGYTYVYWEGGPDSNDDLWEAYWNGSGWVGPYDRGMGPLDSAPSVALYST